MRKIEIIYPDSHRELYTVKGRRNAGSLALVLARAAKLDVKKTRWRLRGPLGPIHPQTSVQNIDLAVGECLKLEPKE